MSRATRLLLPTLLVLGLLLAGAPPAANGAQSPEPTALASEPSAEDAWLDAELARMTPADRVGQLFLVPFDGNDASAGSQVARLVQQLRVGGVILAPENGNLSNTAPAAGQVLSMTAALQTLAFSASAPVTVTTTVPVTFTAPGEPGAAPTPVAPQVLSTVVTLTQAITFPAQGRPLLVAVAQEGDGYPNTALRNGFTELPSNMALGATWKPENAEVVGEIVGRELAAVGVNLLLGPSLDVQVEPRLGLSDYLGTRVFGGDPYWAGKLGQAYVRGVHEGSGGRVATVAKHLPGLGASDRSLEEEVATVDKSLLDLKLIELPPFFAVAQGGTITDTTDAMMTAHIRYRGFQGNIRYVTPPISLHEQGMEQILALSELVQWRAGGGILVSDALGAPAIRRYFSPGLTSFPHRQVALDAFQAGNDLLVLARFSLTDSWEDQMRNAEDTILFFRRLYAEDPRFAERVDSSARRILRLKRKVCPHFSLEGCSPDAGAIAQVGRPDERVSQIGRQAVTLLYPSSDELALRLPRPPRIDEKIVLFADEQQVRECAECAPFYVLQASLLRATILRLYGPEATGQVQPERISAFTFAQLQSYLATGRPDLSQQIGGADWIVFGLLGSPPAGQPGAAALRQFLKESSAGPEAQRVVVMAYGPPYYLDTTEVSKLTAYFGVFGTTSSLVESSVRALFLQDRPQGRSPVSVEGVGYELVKQLSPNPDQQIEVLTAEQPLPVEGTPAPLSLKVGDPLNVRTGTILDRNGNHVPDGTPVVFHYVYQGEGLGGQTEAVTRDGAAEATITLEREGELIITATSEPCRNSRPLVVRLFGGTTEILTPTPLPTDTPTPTPRPSDTPEPTPQPTPVPTELPAPGDSSPLSLPPEPRVRWVDLLLNLIGIVGAGGVVYSVSQRLSLPLRQWNLPLRLSLWSAVGGLLGYLFYGLALPGSQVVAHVVPGLRGLLIGFVGGLVPLAVAGWMARRRVNAK